MDVLSPWFGGSGALSAPTECQLGDIDRHVDRPVEDQPGRTLLHADVHVRGRIETTSMLQLKEKQEKAERNVGVKQWIGHGA